MVIMVELKDQLVSNMIRQNITILTISIQLWDKIQTSLNIGMHGS